MIHPRGWCCPQAAAPNRRTLAVPPDTPAEAMAMLCTAASFSAWMCEGCPHAAMTAPAGAGHLQCAPAQRHSARAARHGRVQPLPREMPPVRRALELQQRPRIRPCRHVRHPAESAPCAESPIVYGITHLDVASGCPAAGWCGSAEVYTGTGIDPDCPVHGHHHGC